MKTKDLVVGNEYAVGPGVGYHKVRGRYLGMREIKVKHPVTKHLWESRTQVVVDPVLVFEIGDLLPYLGGMVKAGTGMGASPDLASNEYGIPARYIHMTWVAWCEREAAIKAAKERGDLERQARRDEICDILGRLGVDLARREAGLDDAGFEATLSLATLRKIDAKLKGQGVPS